MTRTLLIMTLFTLSAHAQSPAPLSRTKAYALVRAADRAAKADEGLAPIERLLKGILTALAEHPGESRVTRIEIKRVLAALAVFFDDGSLRRNPFTRAAFSDFETPAQAKSKHLGRYRFHGRIDLAQHFAVSAGLAAALGKPMADMAGQMKEVRDAAGKEAGRGSGFSFVDMAANRAGVAWALHLLAKGDLAPRLQQPFVSKAWFPSIKGLEEGLTQTELKSQFDGVGGLRYRAAIERIDRRIAALAKARQ